MDYAERDSVVARELQIIMPIYETFKFFPDDIVRSIDIDTWHFMFELYFQQFQFLFFYFFDIVLRIYSEIYDEPYAQAYQNKKC